MVSFDPGAAAQTGEVSPCMMANVISPEIVVFKTKNISYRKAANDVPGQRDSGRAPWSTGGNSFYRKGREETVGCH